MRTSWMGGTGAVQTLIFGHNSPTHGQGLTLVRFSAQLEQCLTQENTLHNLNTPLTRATQSLRAPPIPYMRSS